MKNKLLGHADAPRHWLFVLCLIGLDYFSTLAYLPSIAVDAAGAYAPLAAVFVVLVTWLLVVPVYLYIVGRSPRGRGAIGLLDQLIGGWRGKLLVLALLGFAAADFVVTRSLSIADATEHLLHNPRGHRFFDSIAPFDANCRLYLGNDVCDRIAPYIARPVVITLALSVLTFGLWYFLRRGFTRGVAWLSFVVVSCYLAFVGIVVVSGLLYIFEQPALVTAWCAQIGASESSQGFAWSGDVPWALWLAAAVWAFPQLSLGLSGFELTMTVAPLVRGSRRDRTVDPVAAVRNTRKLILVAAAIMSLLLVSSTLVSTLLIPRTALQEGGAAAHRALAYLAHGSTLANGESATVLNSMFGEEFGNAFDMSTTAILCLAGASVMVGLARLVPGYLHHAGMDLAWAGNVGVIMHVLNAVILIVTVAFHASLADQLWAYATSVLVLIGGAALAAALDAARRWPGSWLGRSAAGGFGVAFLTFAAALGLTISINRSGLLIALSFVAAIFATSLTSRWLRSTELRFEGFTYADDDSHARWRTLCELDRLILVPHRPGWTSVAERDRSIREEYLLSPEAPIAFIEVTLGDPSEFYHRPRISMRRDGDLDIIEVTNAASVSHVLAAIALEIAKSGRPPTLIFGWSFETPLAANLSFLFLGEGNIPWMVKALVRRAAPNAERQPRIIIG